jgi:putative endonuclease
MAKKNSQKFGKEAEELARKHLVNKGFSILQSNWRFKKYEVDIIAESNEFIVFVEVKARSTEAFGEPEMFVTLKKQKFLIAAANNYLQENNIEKEARFDIIGILPINNNYSVKHLEGAFYPSQK